MASATAKFAHQALLYAGTDEFVEACSAFIRDGLAAGQPTLVMVGQHKLDLLRAELGGLADSPDVRFENMEEAGSNPARIIPAWRDFADAHPGQLLRGIGEPIWAGRTPAELIECQRHEALLNLAFAEADGFLLLCPYDTTALADDVIEEARRSHPCIVDGGHEHQSLSYTGVEPLFEPFDAPLPEPRIKPRELAFGPDNLPSVRDFVGGYAMAVHGNAAKLAMAAHEAAANSIRHGGGEGVVRVWDEDGDIICEVRDRGRIDEPLVGRQRPAGLQVGGHGVWLMNQLCDLVQIRTFGDGSAVRLHVRG